MKAFPILQYFRNRWVSPCGYREILTLAVPLVISTGSLSLQHFLDRMFLAWYSADAIAAAMPAGILNFTLITPFLGLGGYVSVFVAQYHGAGQNEKIGPVVWQGIYVALLAGFFFLILSFFSRDIFTLIGHAPSVRENEITYFRIFCLGAFPSVASASMSGFFSGLGRTRVIMTVNLTATAVNIVLDYLLIFGNFGFPRLGMAGAAAATVTASLLSFIAYTLIIFKKKNNENYKVFHLKLVPGLLGRLTRFGLPSGIQFFLDVAGFTLFVLFIGRIDSVSLAATNIAFNINTLSFMPMIGMGVAVSILVGRNLGRNNPELAQYSTWSGFHLAFFYLAAIAVFFAAAPSLFLKPFLAGANYDDIDKIQALATVLLRFVAVYCVFDAMNIIFSSAVKGAGDTRFVMLMVVFLSSLILIVPTYLVLFVFHRGIFWAWGFATAYVIALGIGFMMRFIYGKWKEMRVIEDTAACIPSQLPECPATGFDK